MCITIVPKLAIFVGMDLCKSLFVTGVGVCVSLHVGKHVCPWACVKVMCMQVTTPCACVCAYIYVFFIYARLCIRMPMFVHLDIRGLNEQHLFH